STKIATTAFVTNAATGPKTAKVFANTTSVTVSNGTLLSGTIPTSTYTTGDMGEVEASFLSANTNSISMSLNGVQIWSWTASSQVAVITTTTFWVTSSTAASFVYIIAPSGLATIVGKVDLTGLNFATNQTLATATASSFNVTAYALLCRKL
ncbi:MAG TPA: hypothetical protein VIY48_04130, partial [Candidatus Paceibacterota bacterium]